MSDALKLAEEIERFSARLDSGAWTDAEIAEFNDAAARAAVNNARLIAAALRAMEARCALEDHEAGEPDPEDWGNARSWRSTRGHLLNHWYATEHAYRAAKEGR